MDPKYARPDWMIVTALPGNFFMIILVAWLYLCACHSKGDFTIGFPKFTRPNLYSQFYAKTATDMDGTPLPH